MTANTNGRIYEYTQPIDTWEYSYHLRNLLEVLDRLHPGVGVDELFALTNEAIKRYGIVSAAPSVERDRGELASR